MLGLWILFFYFIIPNVALFGLSALLAWPFARGDRPRHVILTIMCAVLISFGPRLPGMMSDLIYELGNSHVRYVKETVTVPASARLGLNMRLERFTDYADGSYLRDEELILRKARYFETLRLGASDSDGSPYVHEFVGQYLQRTNRILDRADPDSQNVTLRITGRETRYHYWVDISIRSDGTVIAAMKDRFRIRWPGAPTRRREQPWIAYLTQNSILDHLADAAFAGESARYGRRDGAQGPVIELLAEALKFEPLPNPDPTITTAVLRSIEPGNGEEERRKPVRSRAADCLSSSYSDVLSFNRDGVSRRLPKTLQAGDQTYETVSRSCVNSDIALLNRSQSGEYLIAIFDELLNLQCSMQFTVPGLDIPDGYSWRIANFQADELGFRIDWSLRPVDKTRSALTYRGNVLATGPCAKRLAVDAPQ